MRRSVLVAVLLIASGCVVASERPVGVQNAVLEVLVNGDLVDRVDFGEQSAGEEQTLSVTLHNAGGTALTLDALQLLSPSPDLRLLLPDEPVGRLEPGDATTFDLSFASPVNSTLSNTLQVLSDDPEAPRLNIPVHGESIGGSLRLSPDNFTFAATAIGCEEWVEVTVVNDGRSAVRLEDVELLVQQPDTFRIEGMPEVGPTLEPGDALDLLLRWTPRDPVPDSAALVVVSNSPQGIVEGDYHGPPFKNGIRDDFTVGGHELLDVLFVVDVADPDVAVGLQAATPALVSDLQAEGVDFELGVVDGTGAFVGPVTVDGLDPVAALQQAFAGSRPGTGNVLDSAVACLAQGGCDWMGRDGAGLHVVFVTDRAEASTGGAASALIHQLALIRGPEESHFSVLSGGSVGCSGLAVEAGADGGLTALLEATSGTSGLVCAADHAPLLQAVAATTRPLLTRFPLTEVPDPSTLWVDYEGAPRSGGHWAYDPIGNAVLFTSARRPSRGDDLVVTYDVDACIR